MGRIEGELLVILCKCCCYGCVACHDCCCGVDDRTKERLNETTSFSSAPQQRVMYDGSSGDGGVGGGGVGGGFAGTAGSVGGGAPAMPASVPVSSDFAYQSAPQ